MYFLYPALAQAFQLTLAWDPNMETDLAGYKIYIATHPENIPGSSMWATGPQGRRQLGGWDRLLFYPDSL